MLTFIYKQFFVLFFLFVEIKIAIVFEKIFAILIIKVCNFVVLIILDSLRFKEDNLNIESCNCNNKEKVFLKNFNFLFSLFLFCLL